MATQSFGLLDQSEEGQLYEWVKHAFRAKTKKNPDALHLTRLLNVEERPFLRVSKRLLAKDAMLRSFPTQLPTPPPDEGSAEETTATAEAAQQKQEQDRRLWREEVLLDFELLEGVLIRIQFLKDSNERERQRYAAEKSKILETGQAVRDNTVELRVQLEDAQKMLALRKEYDALTEKITANRMLRPREEQHSQLEKLNAEIADLEQEGREYAITWEERKEQFGKITAEGKQMMRLIRGEKDEPEKDEGMEDADADGDVDVDAETEPREDGETSTTKGDGSRVGTPRPDLGGATPVRGGLESNNATPPGQSKLLPKPSGLGFSTPALQDSRPASPAPASLGGMTPAAKDTDMADELEEGEAAEDSVVEGERMDVT